MDVTLSQEEMLEACVAGCRRRIVAISEGRVHRGGAKRPDRWEVDIQATGAEVAAAKAFGKYWAGISDSTRDWGDLAGGWEVRWRSRPDGRLYVYETDPHDRIVVLVTGEMPTYTIVGGIPAGEAKKKRWRVGEGGNFAVPQGELWGVDELNGTRDAA